MSLVTVRPYVVWGAGVVAYIAAVLQRTTLGVSGLQAAAHFSASASIVATFGVVQLLTYALAQIPAGIALDRWGARATLTAGALAMTAGQALLASTDQIGWAICARIIVGCGDALTFSSAIRLVPAWFPARRVPLLTQLTGILGQLGQVLSAIPFVGILLRFGWAPAFGSAAVVGLAAALVSLLLVRSAPAGAVREAPHPQIRRLGGEVVRIVSHPATRLGFWTHATAGFPGMVFALMWGFPYLTAAERLPVPTASLIMTLFVLASIAAGPFVGAMTQRHPLRRSSLVLLIVAACVLPLLALVLWPGPAPLWLILIWVLGMSIGGPGSSVGLDFPRTHLPGHRLGTATGVVIMGGFLAALLSILAMGLVLDALAPAGVYTLGIFRLALAIQLPVLGIGVIGMLVSRRRLRRRMAERGLVVPRWREVWRQGRLTRL